MRPPVGASIASRPPSCRKVSVNKLNLVSDPLRVGNRQSEYRADLADADSVQNVFKSARKVDGIVVLTFSLDFPQIFGFC